MSNMSNMSNMDIDVLIDWKFLLEKEIFLT